MKKLFSCWGKWLIPVFLLAVGYFLNYGIHGHGFLGLISYCLAGVVAAFYIIALLKKRYPKLSRVLKIVLICSLCVGALIFAGTEALIIHASFGNPEMECDYVVVLGAKVNGTSPSVSLNDRIVAAEVYLKENPDVIAVLSGGQGEDEGISEAECMARELIARGIAPERLWLEDKATSTWENLKFSLDLIEERTGVRPESIGLLSSEYHLFRASLFATDCGVDAVGIPAATSWVTIRVNYFLREVAGIWHYLLLGGQYHD